MAPLLVARWETLAAVGSGGVYLEASMQLRCAADATYTSPPTRLTLRCVYLCAVPFLSLPAQSRTSPGPRSSTAGAEDLVEREARRLEVMKRRQEREVRAGWGVDGAGGVPPCSAGRRSIWQHGWPLAAAKHLPASPRLVYAC